MDSQCPFRQKKAIPSDIKTIKKQGIDPSNDLDGLRNGPLADKWAELKSEIYAIMAVVIERAIGDILDQRSPLLYREKMPPLQNDRYVNIITRFSDINAINKEIINALKVGLSFDLLDYDNLPDDDSFKPVWEEYRKLSEIARHKIDQLEVLNDAANFDIEAGINTGTGEIFCALTNIIKLWERKFPNEPLTIDKFVKIAKHSYPYIATVASLHKSTLPTVPFKMESFELVPFNFSYKLQLTEQGRLQIKLPSEEKISLHDRGERVGCPALKGSIIKRIYQLYMDMIQKVSEENLRENPNFTVSDLYQNPDQN